MLFYLCIIERDALPKMDRVALVDASVGRCLQEIQAAGWQEAREQIDERGLVQVAGHGWHLSQRAVAGKGFLL